VRFVHQSVFAATPAQVFAFHERPDALKQLMPPWSPAEVLQPPASLRVGERAVLRVRLAPLVWVRWEAQHTRYEKDSLFEDVQTRGPFRRWRHLHRIAPHADGALLSDEIDLELPLSPLSLPARPLVRLQLQRLFEYRHAVTRAAVEGATASEVIHVSPAR
jgi:ligand-binding SRPBCC domain-containing protein